ncbi:MAG: AbiV family abortive infection protein [Candidatus Heimdallarchaeota archaeon]
MKESISLNRDHYRGLILHSYENAKQFLRDAEILLENNSPGHAYSFCVFAFEEWSKALTALNLMLGVEQPQDQDVQAIFRNHRLKHRNALVNAFLGLFIQWIELSPSKDEISSVFSDFYQNGLSEESMRRKFRKIGLEENTHESSVIVSFLDLIEDFERNPRLIEDRRLQGIYVGFDFKTGATYGPFNFTVPETREKLETYQTLIEGWEGVYEVLKNRKLQNKFIKPLYKLGEFLLQYADPETE